MPEIFSSPTTSTVPNDDHAQQPSAQTPMDQKAQTNHKTRTIDDYSEVMRREKPSRHHWHAYIPKPVKTAFDTQTREENIVLLLRPHPITQLKQFIIIGIALALPMFTHLSFLVDFLPANYLTAVFLSWYMLTFTYALSTFLIWFFSVFIITDERIIDVDFVSMLFKDVSTAKIDDIQDISSKTGGFLASVVDYGTVYIQTAGEQREVEFENIPHPAKVAALLNELMLEEEREKVEGRVQ